MALSFLLGSKTLTARKKGRSFPFPPVTVLSSALQLSLYPHLSREGLTSAERGGGGRGGLPTVGKVPEKRRKGEKESNRWHDINHGDNGCIMSITRREEEEEDGNAAASADRRRGWGKRCGISFFFGGGTVIWKTIREEVLAYCRSKDICEKIVN